MEKQESGNFMEWINSLTIEDASNLISMIVFGIIIIVIVVRTFRNKPTI